MHPSGWRLTRSRWAYPPKPRQRSVSPEPRTHFPYQCRPAQSCRLQSCIQLRVIGAYAAPDHCKPAMNGRLHHPLGDHCDDHGPAFGFKGAHDVGRTFDFPVESWRLISKNGNDKRGGLRRELKQPSELNQGNVRNGFDNAPTLPVHPDKQTFSASIGMSQRCQSGHHCKL